MYPVKIPVPICTRSVAGYAACPKRAQKSFHIFGVKSKQNCFRMTMNATNALCMEGMAHVEGTGIIFATQSKLDKNMAVTCIQNKQTRQGRDIVFQKLGEDLHIYARNRNLSL